MGILNGYDTKKIYKVDNNGDYKLQSYWTHVDTVHLPDGDSLTNKINSGVYIGDEQQTQEYIADIVIDDNSTSTEKVWSSQKTSDTINSVTNTTYTLTGNNDVVYLTDSDGNEQSVIVDHVNRSDIAGEAFSLVHSCGTGYRPVYFDSTGVPTPVLFENLHGVIAPGSSYNFTGKRGIIYLYRAATSTTPSIALFDQWGGLITLSDNSSMKIIMLENYDGDGSEFQLVNDTSAYITYMVMNGVNEQTNE